MNTSTRRCPACGRRYTFIEPNPHRPFCSERCQLIDLGDWLAENHRIKGEDIPTTAPDEESLI